MSDQRIYRIAGICSLAAVATFFIEFPFYLARGPFPAMTEPLRLADYAARNAANIMTCVLLDFVILTLVLIFSAGFRHLLHQSDPRLEWLGALFFGVALVYVTLTLVADSLQAATVVDALTAPAEASIIRTMMESMYLMYGAVGLWLMAVMMAIAGYATLASHALPRWCGWVGYACALACLGFVPSMFVHHVDVNGFYNPAGWGVVGVAAGLPLTLWMVAVGIAMLRIPDKRNAGIATRGIEGSN
jgi:Domain of unknown function (DUF4386)